MEIKSRNLFNMIRENLQKLLLTIGVGGFFVGVINVVSNPTPALSHKAEYCLELEDLIRDPVFSCSTPEGLRAYKDITQDYSQLIKIHSLKKEIIKYNKSQEGQRNGLIYLGLGIVSFATGALLYCMEGDKKRYTRALDDTLGLSYSNTIINCKFYKPYNPRLTEKPAYISSMHDEEPLSPSNYLPPWEVKGFEINPRELEKRFKGKNN